MIANRSKPPERIGGDQSTREGFKRLKVNGKFTIQTPKPGQRADGLLSHIVGRNCAAGA